MRTLRVVFLVSLTLVAIAVMATTVRPLRFDEVRDRADTVIVGTVASATAGTSLHGALVVDHYRVTVVETIRGASLKNVIVHVPRIDGAPRLRTGTKYVFFLGAGPARPLVSVQQGIFRFEQANAANQPAMLLISGAGEPLVVSSDGLVRLGTPVSIENRQVKTIEQAPSVDIGVPDLPSGADGVSPMRAPASAEMAKPAVRRYATLDDLRRFVRSDTGRRTR